jgi:PAP2 superfamily.
MDSNVAMWLIGAWLYVAVPSLGPAYRFPEIWLPLAAQFVHSQAYQHLLMTNYQNVLAYARGVARPVNVLFGIAAFPSLHVAFQTLVFLWMRRVWRAGEMLFAIFTAVIFVGSVVTGWHYLVDGLAGFALAWACFALSFRAHRMSRWLRIHDAR